jgi:hypothetical protein
VEETVKINILPVDPAFQPDRQNYRMPTHGRDWGVEQDFRHWLYQRPDLLADSPREADWDYLPVFWNRYYIESWGQEGLEELQDEILHLVSRNRPTFTICEYDVQDMQPFYDLCGMVVFTASRRDDAHERNIDIPLLCSRHDRPATLPEKRHLASFAGNLATDGLRLEMAERFAGREGLKILNGNWGPEFFTELLLESYIALAPRGHGGQSFRFYEAMDLGVVPFHIGTPDTRPFRRWIDWEACSLYAPTVAEMWLPEDREALLEMGTLAQQIYEGHLQYGQWCRFVLKELSCL